MIDQLNAAKTVIKSALDGQIFVDEDGPTTLKFFLGSLPGKREAPGNGQDVPFCLLEPGGFEFTKEGKSQEVQTTLGLYIPGGNLEALQRFNDIITAVESISTKLFTPCKLVGKGIGQAPTIDHPFYQVTISINLYKPRVQ